jgi:peptide deformylase
MTDLHFVDCHDPLLDLPSHPLSIEEIKDPKTQLFFDAMLALARGEQSDQQKAVLVGLAAPQIGKRVRVILVDTKADGKGNVSELRLYINPEILEYSQETTDWYEGCFSTGSVKGIVSRPNEIKVKALDRNGHEIYESHSGYVARIFQHEIDHLNGIRFPERVPPESFLHLVKTEEMYAYRNGEGWRNWKKTIPQKEWKEHI